VEVHCGVCGLAVTTVALLHDRISGDISYND
jgi:hypothetical protein